MYDFSYALAACKDGKKISRQNWNGKGQYVYFVPAGKYPPSTLIAMAEFSGEDVPYRAYFALKTVQGDVVPWVPSVSDILADDWIIL